MAIKTGIGVGSAQVFDTSGIVNNLYKSLEKKQKERDLFAAEIADSLSRFDPSGLYGEDLKEVNDLYSAIKTKNYSANSLKPMDKALAKTSVAKDIQNLNERVAYIKKYNTDKQKLLLDMVEDGSKYTDQAREIAKAIKDLPYSRAGEYGDLSKVMLMRRPDTAAIEKGLSYMDKVVEDVAKSSAGKSRTAVSGDTIFRYFSADPNVIKPQAKALILSNDDIEFSLKESFKADNPNIQNPNVDQLTDYFLKIREGRLGKSAYEVQGGQKEVDKPSKEKESVQEQWSAAINGLFTPGMDRERLLNMFKAQGKGRIADIIVSGSGYEIIPAIPVKLGKGGATKLKPGKPVFVGDPYEFARVLGENKVGSAGFGAVTRLASPPSDGKKSSTPTEAVYIVDGVEYKIPSNKVSAFLKDYPKAKRK
jgi:hypothetical protein